MRLAAVPFFLCVVLNAARAASDERAASPFSAAIDYARPRVVNRSAHRFVALREQLQRADEKSAMQKPLQGIARKLLGFVQVLALAREFIEVDGGAECARPCLDSIGDQRALHD